MAHKAQGKNFRSGMSPVEIIAMFPNDEAAEAWFVSVRTHSAMEASNLGYQKRAVAFYIFTTDLKGVSSVKLHRKLGITQKSAWFMARRIRETCKSDGGLFGGPVEVDETHIGGTFHHFSPKHLDRCVTELSGRSNMPRSTPSIR